MKALMTLSLVFFGLASAAQADYRCTTRSNGRSFSETRSEYDRARSAVIRECRNDYGTYNSDCERHVSCSYAGNNGNGNPPRPGNPPSVGARSCYVKQTGQWVDGDRFFSLVHEWTQNNYRCAVAKIATVPYSGRIYNRDGSRVAKERGGLSNSEIDRILNQYGLYGCERFTCEERNW